MNTELLGMSDEELIQWLVAHAPITESHAWGLYPAMELYCAQYPISLTELAKRAVVGLKGDMQWTDIRRALLKGINTCE